MTREGVGAIHAPPQPGEEIPSHKLRMEGLPRSCTEDMVLEWMGVHAEQVNQNYNNAKESFKKGIALYKSADGWLTGKGAVKFRRWIFSKVVSPLNLLYKVRDTADFSEYLPANPRASELLLLSTATAWVTLHAVKYLLKRALHSDKHLLK